MLFRRIFTDTEGNVAPLLALAMIPILGAISAAVDYSRANLERSAMQAALDSTALMLAKEVQTLSPADIQSKATAYFTSIFSGNQATNVTVTSTLTNPEPGSFVLNVKSSAKVPTSFSKVIGQSEINISAKAEAIWGIKKLNLALALDNTGSRSSFRKPSTSCAGLCRPAIRSTVR
jgi:Flp pilus assembly protein TadG